MCFYGEGLHHSPTKFPSEVMLKTMKSSLQGIPSIKWQYFGTEEGVIAIYPAFDMKDKTYDPRFRQELSHLEKQNIIYLCSSIVHSTWISFHVLLCNLTWVAENARGYII